MRVAMLTSLLGATAFAAAGCAPIANPYPNATTVAECQAEARTARQNLSYNSDSTARAFGRGLIESMERNCIARVLSAAPASQTPAPRPAVTADTYESQPVVKTRAGRLQSKRARAAEGGGFCPRHAGVIYGGTTYCIGN